MMHDPFDDSLRSQPVQHGQREQRRQRNEVLPVTWPESWLLPPKHGGEAA
jgi:hypothetical protein